MVIAGGTDAGINEAVFAGLSNMGPLSERNDDPTGASRPFDSDREERECLSLLAGAYLVGSFLPGVGWRTIGNEENPRAII